MDEKFKFVEPYIPSLIHMIYRWIDRLPGPYWLFSIAILVVTGLLNLIVAWEANVLTFGEMNWYYAAVGFFVAYFFFANDFLLGVAKNAVIEFLTILDVDENKRRRILFEFTHLPARTSDAFFIFGAFIGFFTGIYLLPTAPEMNRSFPVLEVTMSAKIRSVATPSRIPAWASSVTAVRLAPTAAARRASTALSLGLPVSAASRS